MKIILSIVFLFGFLICESQAQEPAVFPSAQSSQDHEPNADPQSDFWKNIKGVSLERSITGEPDPLFRSEARSRWTKDNLYFLFIGPYQTLHLKPDPDTKNETYKLWFFDVFELDLGSNFSNINLYGEFQISPQSEFADLGIDASVPRPGWHDERLWNTGMTVKSRIDPDKKIWYGEMRIPIASFDKRPVEVGREFRVNTYRLQYTDEKRPHFLAWQPTGEWTPHRPAKFGLLKLVSMEDNR